ncbi:MAG: penicillin-binding protein 1C [Nitrospirae bacterium]|nr:penicillin-binding protein 1C [Nitrospirota bacterium]
MINKSPLAPLCQRGERGKITHSLSRVLILSNVFLRWLLVWLILVACPSNSSALPTFEEVKKSYKKSDAVLLDRHGAVIHELRVDAKGRRLDWKALKEISPALIKVVLHTEDKRFYEHSGVDWKAAGAAAIKNVFSAEKRGASTITMQVAAMLDKELRPKTKKRSMAQKWDQMQAARQLEGSWKKDEILDAYLNLVTFRGELQGITSASRGLFEKDASGLDDQESVILASLIRGPNASPDAVAKRACLLAEAMRNTSTCDNLKALAAKALVGPYGVKQRTGLAPQVAQKLLKNNMTSAASTLDGGLQRFASDTLTYHLAAVRKQNVHDGAVLVVDNRTGEILAYVANSGDLSTARHLDGIIARRQAGSTLKPFLYGLAFDRQLLRPTSVLVDSPLDVPTVFGVYRPENYDNDFKGPVQARDALASSLNVPAVKTLTLVGVGAFVSKLGEVGFSQLESDEHYGFSIALGTADVTLYELVNAYRTLANRGVWSELKITPVKMKAKKRRVYSEEAAFLVSDILSDREARSLTFSLENPLATKFWTAVKTGTSKDMRDNWCIGYSERYTVGVWVGNFNGEPMWNVSGVTGAAPIWHEVMSYLHAKETSRSPKMPKDMIIQAKNERTSDARNKELAIKGTEPASLQRETTAQTESSSFMQRITYPAEGMIIALDPDIPEDQQRVFFEANRAGDHLRWRLNSREIGRASEIISWQPVPGTYTISLVDTGDAIIDSVHFMVKGN